MAWIEGEHCKKITKPSTNELLAQVEGNLEDLEASVWFAKFCRANPYFAVQLLTGQKLYEIQDILIRALMQRDYSIIIAGRGFSKSWMISIFIILFAVFNPGSRIGICSGTFRQSKQIFKQIMKFVEEDGGTFLRQCVTKAKRQSTDAWEVGIGGSDIVATPMGGGDRLRGYRFNLMVMDELLLVPGEIINNVIMPFLSVKQNARQEQDIRRAEDILIAAGKMTEDERLPFPGNKLIGLSSASFKFESLYKDNYQKYVSTILDKKATGVNHAAFRLSYQVAPKFLDEKLINEARRTMSKAQFDREFEAIFTDDSGGYFSLARMEANTLAPGQAPSVLVKGRPGKEYILGIDPNYNDAETSDNFAMSLIELSPENDGGVLVHGYALAKGGIKKRAAYLRYLLTHFDIRYIIVDGSGGGEQFIRDCSELGMLPRNLEKFNADFMNPYIEEGLMNARQSYNFDMGRIIHSQAFGQTNWKQHANTLLQGMIEHGRIKFASKVSATDDFTKFIDTQIPIEELEYDNFPVEENADYRGRMADFTDHLEKMISMTKDELGLIEVTTSSNGNQDFNLPKNLRNDASNPLRARRDSYTSFLMATYAMHCYYNLKRHGSGDEFDIFLPVWAVK
jgi:hypothetical protein